MSDKKKSPHRDKSKMEGVKKKKIIRKKNTTLEGFLSQYVIKKSDAKSGDIEASHTSMGPPFGKYYIPDEKLSKFHNFYHHHVFDNNLDCHIVERHQAIGPIVIDLDFKYEMKKTDDPRIKYAALVEKPYMKEREFIRTFFKQNTGTHTLT